MTSVRPHNSSSPDLLWPHFSALWVELSSLSPEIQLLGGYGLNLRLQSLLRGESPKAFVHPRSWLNTNFRPAKDLDFIASTEALTNPYVQRRVDEILSAQNYNVVRHKKRWQFEKFVSKRHRISLDFMTIHPPLDSTEVTISKGRAKPRPSFKAMGFHGRLSHESPASLDHASEFLYFGHQIRCLSPLGLIGMKLEAMRKKWDMSLEEWRPANKRQIKIGLATKHGVDILMIIAMLSPQEVEAIPQMIASARRAPIYAESGNIVRRIMMDKNSPITLEALKRWRASDVDMLREQLLQWFPAGVSS